MQNRVRAGAAAGGEAQRPVFESLLEGIDLDLLAGELIVPVLELGDMSFVSLLGVVLELDEDGLQGRELVVDDLGRVQGRRVARGDLALKLLEVALVLDHDRVVLLLELVVFRLESGELALRLRGAFLRGLHDLAVGLLVLLLRLRKRTEHLEVLLADFDDDGERVLVPIRIAAGVVEGGVVLDLRIGRHFRQADAEPGFAESELKGLGLLAQDVFRVLHADVVFSKLLLPLEAVVGKNPQPDAEEHEENEEHDEHDIGTAAVLLRLLQTCHDAPSSLGKVDGCDESGTYS